MRHPAMLISILLLSALGFSICIVVLARSMRFVRCANWQERQGRLARYRVRHQNAPVTEEVDDFTNTLKPKHLYRPVYTYEENGQQLELAGDMAIKRKMIPIGQQIIVLVDPGSGAVIAKPDVRARIAASAMGLLVTGATVIVVMSALAGVL